MKYTLTLQTAPGNGLLTRKAVAVMFVPTPAAGIEKLLTAFVSAPDGAEFDAVAASLLENDFALPSFACLVADSQISLRVFGEVELRTDQRSVPMLSGAGLATWVDHQVPGSPEVAQIAVSDTDLDELTDVVLGTVNAGGFNLLLTSGPRESDSHEKADTTGSNATDGPVPQAATSGANNQADIVSYVLEAFPEGPEDQSDEDKIGVTNDLDGSVEADITLNPSEVSSENAPPSAASAPASSDSPPLISSSDSLDNGLVDGGHTIRARVCTDGHANDPARVTCDVCNAFLLPGEAGIRSVAPPALGQLVFDDGEKLAVSTDVVVGRNPLKLASANDCDSLVVEGDRVSRAHLIIRVQNWDVAIEDCGSRNGTVVVGPDGAQPIGLTPQTPQLIGQGTTVYFGSRSFVYETEQKGESS